MTIGKKINTEYSAGIPLALGDRYYSQDLERDFHFLRNEAGQSLKDLVVNFPVLISGGIISQGGGANLNITAGAGFVKFDVTIPDTFAAIPPSTTTGNIDSVRVFWGALTNINASVTGCSVYSITDDGVTPNYVKVRYNEANGNTRTRAKAGGSYAYERTPFYDIQVNNVAPVALYELCLGTFTSSGGTYTITQTPYTAHALALNSVVDVSTGWISAGAETWAYASAASPNFTFTMTGDKTSKYSKDMKVRITQSKALTNYWTFDSNNSDSVGSAVMTDIATPTYSAGKFNNGLTLNGSSQALKVADNTFKPTGDFTIGMWVKAASPASMTLFQSFRISTQWSGIKVQTAVTTGYPLVTIAANSGTVLNTDYSLITGKTNVCDNAFHYLVVTYKDNMVKIYVDGALNAFGYSLAPVYNATTYTRIGVYTPDGTTNSLWWAGQIDDLFLINGAVLDEQTIKEKYVAQTAQGTGNLTLTKYFTINSVSYTPSTTTISIFGGSDYTLANATISSPYYAMVETPFRMDKNLNKWNLLTYPYRTFLTTGSFVPPAWATKIFYMIQAHGGSGGLSGQASCGGGGGGAGGILMGFKDIAEFDGNYGITFGTGTNPTYFNAFPTLTATVGLIGIAGFAGSGSPVLVPGAAGGEISGTGVVTFGTGIGGCSGGNSGRSDGLYGLSDGGRGGAGIAGTGGIGGVGDGGNGGAGGYGSGGGGAAGWSAGSAGTAGAGGAACAILWFF